MKSLKSVINYLEASSPLIFNKISLILLLTGFVAVSCILVKLNQEVSEGLAQF